MRFAAKPESASAARRFTLGELDGGHPQTTDMIVLLISEVVTNAVLHGGPYPADGEIVVNIEHGDGVVRVEVFDANTDPPAIAAAGADGGLRASGRGMAIVEALASAWGVRPNGSGKWVWFEVWEP